MKTQQYEDCKKSVLGGYTFDELEQKIDNNEIKGKDILESLKWTLDVIDDQAKIIQLLKEINDKQEGMIKENNKAIKNVFNSLREEIK